MVTREQVRAMLRKMLPEVALRFEDERANEAPPTQGTVSELFSDDLVGEDLKDASLSVLDRLDLAAEWRDWSERSARSNSPGA